MSLLLRASPCSLLTRSHQKPPPSRLVPVQLCLPTANQTIRNHLGRRVGSAIGNLRSSRGRKTKGIGIQMLEHLSGERLPEKCWYNYEYTSGLIHNQINKMISSEYHRALAPFVWYVLLGNVNWIKWIFIKLTRTRKLQSKVLMVAILTMVYLIWYCTRSLISNEVG